MMVKPASRMFSAISFGVFCRSAPSTSLIMRSRKVEPGAAVMRTTIQSESTVRAAGHRRTVAAGFANDRRGLAGDRRLVDRGDAFDHLAVARDDVARLDQHDVADLQARSPGTTCRFLRSRAGQQLGLRLGARALRSASACALPRPSATASAKFANSTVNHSHMTIWNSKPSWPPPVTRSRIRMTVVSAVTTSSTNITGFLISVARIELDEGLADRRHDDLRIEQRRDRHALAQFRGFHGVTPKIRSEQRAGQHREMFDDRAERERREEGQAADDQDDADQQADEQAAGGRERAGRRRHGLLLRRASPQSPSPE